MHEDALGNWRLDPEVELELRLQRVHKALAKGEPAEAIIEAEELLDSHPRHPDALFLLAEALLEVGDAENAVEVYELHLEEAEPKAGALTGLALARFEMCRIQGALEAAREATRLAPEMAEAHHALGLVLERAPGRQSEAVSHLLAAHRLDPEAYPLPVELTATQWQDAISEAMQRLPATLQEFWSKVPLRLEDLPDLNELRQFDPPQSPTVSALHAGGPPDGPVGPDDKPSALRIFRTNLARLGSVDAIVDELAHALEQEALDWLGTAPQEQA